MAEIPPAGGPADVSSMLDAWLAEDQGAVTGAWGPIEPGTGPAPAPPAPDAAEAPPAAASLSEAITAEGPEAVVTSRAAITEDPAAVAAPAIPSAWAQPAPDLRPDPSLLEPECGGGSDVAAGEGEGEAEIVWPQGQAPVEPPARPALSDGTSNEGFDAATGDGVPGADSTSPDEETPAEHADLPEVSEPAVDAWLTDDQALGASQWAPDAGPASAPDAPATEPGFEPRAAAVAEHAEAPRDARVNDEQGGSRARAAVETAGAPAPFDTPTAATQAEAPPAPPRVEAAAAPDADAPATPSNAGAAPAQPATLLEAVSALDTRGGDVVDAETPQPGSAPDRAVQDRFVLFTVAGAQYAVRETFVTELDRVPKITTVPNVPAWVRGVTNRRGDILSVIEIRGLLGLERIAAANERMLVVRLLDDSCSLGMLVDDVQQIVSMPPGDVRPPAATLEGVLAPFLDGVFEFNGKAVAVLDLDRMLRSEPVRQFDEPPAAEG